VKRHSQRPTARQKMGVVMAPNGDIVLSPEMGSELVAIGDPEGNPTYVTVVELPERS
jgi:hypothetical protein